MGSLVLVPVPETTWSAADRVVGRSPVPLSEKGIRQAGDWAAALAKNDCRVTTVYCSGEQAAMQTAERLSSLFGARVKKKNDLAEVRVGLFDGLSRDELKRRHPKMFKRWWDDPSAVTPPEGEVLADAQRRLRGVLEDITLKLGDRTVAVVLGPLAFGAARCMLESVPLDHVRSMIQSGPLRYPAAEGVVLPTAAVNEGGSAS